MIAYTLMWVVGSLLVGGVFSLILLLSDDYPTLAFIIVFGIFGGAMGAAIYADAHPTATADISISIEAE